MGRKRANPHRKRKVIDLDSLGKKQRKLYRDEGRPRVNKKEDEEEMEDTQEDIYQQPPEDEDDDISDEESNPYQQLVATFSSKPTTAIDSDDDDNDEIPENTDDGVEENDDDDDDDDTDDGVEENDDDDDNDGDNDAREDEEDNEVDEVNDDDDDDEIDRKIKRLEKKLKQAREDGDLDSDLDGEELEDDEGIGAEEDDASDSSSEEQEDNEISKRIRRLEKKLKQTEDVDLESDLDNEDIEGSWTEESDNDGSEVEQDENAGSNDEVEITANNSEEEQEEEDDGGDDNDDDTDNDDENNVSSEDEADIRLKEEETNNDLSLSQTDPFISHFERDLHEDDVTVMNSNRWKSENLKMPGVAELRYMWSCNTLKNVITNRKDKDLINQHVKSTLCQTLTKLNKNGNEEDSLNPFQQGIFSILNNYQDFLYTERSTSNGEEIRLVYCLHALNHVLKTRKRVLSNNTKIKQKTKAKEDFDIRDQGLTRPKVLMVLPFKESAFRVVKMLIQLLGESDKSLISKKKRFVEEYGLEEDDINKHSRKPDDYQELFAGNCDDHFRIGIGIAKKTMKLYTQFYKADIILASPLGLRTLIKTEGEKDRDYDFLSSIEVLIIDQTDVLMMQNWEHVLHLMNHMHLQPKESHDVDFSRVRMWTLNGWSKFYRQTMMFSSYSIPEVNSLFNKHCFNYAGKYVCIRRPSTGTICQVAVQVPQVFHRIDCSSYTHMPDDRFNFFIKKILPQHFDSLMAQTLIYVPSYFDFVRLRNHLTKEEIKFSSVNEYGSEKQTNTARNLFFQKLVPFMLYTERYHFFKRGYITGIRHIIFYGLPQYPHFYSEMCNMVQTTEGKLKGDHLTCTVLYTKYEAQKLSEIVGSDRAGKMLNSGKSVHMFVTGDND